MSNRPDSARLGVWRQFITANAMITAKLENELDAERGLPLAWYDVLLQLSEAPEGRLRMQDLARRVLHSKSGLTRLFDRMQSAGLVRREPCPDDRRGAFAVLTPAGRMALRRAAPVHLRGIQQHFATFLSDDEALALQSFLGKALAAAGWSEGGPPDDSKRL